MLRIPIVKKLLKKYIFDDFFVVYNNRIDTKSNVLIKCTDAIRVINGSGTDIKFSIFILYNSIFLQGYYFYIVHFYLTF